MPWVITWSLMLAEQSLHVGRQTRSRYVLDCGREVALASEPPDLYHFHRSATVKDSMSFHVSQHIRGKGLLSSSVGESLYDRPQWRAGTYCGAVRNLSSFMEYLTAPSQLFMHTSKQQSVNRVLRHVPQLASQHHWYRAKRNAHQVHALTAPVYANWPA